MQCCLGAAYCDTAVGSSLFRGTKLSMHCMDIVWPHEDLDRCEAILTLQRQALMIASFWQSCDVGMPTNRDAAICCTNLQKRVLCRELIQIISQSQSGILLTSYDQLRIQRAELLSINWGYAVLDEGHKIRNPDAEVNAPIFNVWKILSDIDLPPCKQ